MKRWRQHFFQGLTLLKVKPPESQVNCFTLGNLTVIST